MFYVISILVTTSSFLIFCCHLMFRIHLKHLIWKAGSLSSSCLQFIQAKQHNTLYQKTKMVQVLHSKNHLLNQSDKCDRQTGKQTGEQNYYNKVLHIGRWIYYIYLHCMAASVNNTTCIVNKNKGDETKMNICHKARSTREVSHCATCE